MGTAGRIEATAWDVIKGIFDQVPISQDDILVDIGCGDGDIIAHWLERGLRNEIIGMELDEETFLATEERFVEYPNVTIILGNAAKYPPRGTLYYLFNPFLGEEMQSFEQAVPRTARIIYYNPKELQMFGNWNVREIWSTHPKAVLIEAKKVQP